MGYLSGLFDRHSGTVWVVGIFLLLTNGIRLFIFQRPDSYASAIAMLAGALTGAALGAVVLVSAGDLIWRVGVRLRELV
jgi:hypothetical protein